MYDKQHPLRVFTAFSGYDAQCLALERLERDFPGFGYDLVGWSEVEKNAIAAHNALFPQWRDRNYGDICKVNWGEVPDFDLFTMSSPCQDFQMPDCKREVQRAPAHVPPFCGSAARPYSRSIPASFSLRM